jgi:hypothetical protein
MADIQTKRCTRCKEIKPVSLFRSRGGRLAHLLTSHCKECLRQNSILWAQKNPHICKEYNKRNTWSLKKRCARRGITPELLMLFLEEQDGKCPLCAVAIGIMGSAIDHNHSTGEFRGLLCSQCNRALGMFLDSEVILRRAAEYVKDKGSYAKKP